MSTAAEATSTAGDGAPIRSLKMAAASASETTLSVEDATRTCVQLTVAGPAGHTGRTVTGRAAADTSTGHATVGPRPPPTAGKRARGPASKADPATTSRARAEIHSVETGCFLHPKCNIAIRVPWFLQVYTKRCEYAIISCENLSVNTLCTSL